MKLPDWGRIQEVDYKTANRWFRAERVFQAMEGQT